MDYTELGKKPIPGLSPAGQDARNDPAFEIVTAEIEKLSSATLTGGIDWKKAAAAAATILDEKSKDLLVMAYLCIALEKCEGLGGLAKGIHILREGVETFWEDMFPAKKRMRGRKNAVEWLTDRIRDDLPSLQAEQWSAADRERFLEDFDALDRFLSENMEDAPILIPLVNEVSAKVAAEEKSAPTPETPPPAPSAPVSGRPSVPEFGPADMDAEKALDQTFDVLGRVSVLLGTLDPPHPLAFRLNRIAAWMQINELPPATGSKTLIPGPESQIVVALQTLYQSRYWKDLLQTAESHVRQFLFWLDLSRYVAESLQGLGHQEGADVVCDETLLYVKRISGIEQLSFEDGTPFADETTKNWLNSLQEKQGDNGAGNGLPGARDIRSAVEEALTQARRLIGDHKTTEALRLVNEGLCRPSSVKEKFLWQQGLCRLFFELQQPRLAVPQMQDMLAVIDAHGIERWEPDLATEALAVIATGLRMQPEIDQDQVGRVLDRLARLDPVRALDFT